MKILFISDASSSHTAKWVNSLNDRGHEVHLVYLANHFAKKQIINDGIIHHPLKYGGMKGYFINALELRKLAKSIKPDIINVHYASGYGTLSRLAGLKDSILSVWGSDVYEFPYQSSFKRRLLLKNLRYPRKLASTSNVMADQVRSLLEDKSLNITITPFGIDTKRFKPKGSQKNEDIIIGNLKILSKLYGFDDLINAIKLLKDRLEKEGLNDLSKKIKLYIYGGGPERENLEELSKNLGLEDTVRFCGEIPNTEVPEAISDFSIFCATSHQESFGVSLIEAMAMEVPVVATDVPGFKEITEENVTGIIVKTKDVSDIANGLEKLVKDETLRHKMGKAGRERVLKYYDWDKNVDTMLELYKETMDEIRLLKRD